MKKKAPTESKEGEAVPSTKKKAPTESKEADAAKEASVKQHLTTSSAAAPIDHSDEPLEQMNVFRPLKAGVVPELPGSLHTMPDGVRVALPIPHYKQTPYIRYTTDTGVFLWVCTGCRKALSYWLL